MKRYYEFDEINPTIKAFSDQYLSYAKECTDDGVTVGSHQSLKTSVSVYCENDDVHYDIVGLDVEQLMGCGCWSGIQIVIKKREDNNG